MIALFSPFNIQDDFCVAQFYTRSSVRETAWTIVYRRSRTRLFAPEVIEAIHKQTGGQPFLVNRFAQMLTRRYGHSEKLKALTMTHFSQAHGRLCGRK